MRIVRTSQSKLRRLWFLFQQAKSEQEPTLSDEMEFINNLSIKIKTMTFRHNKIENVLDDSIEAKHLRE